MKCLPSLALFVICIAAFFAVMAAVKAGNERAETECRVMVREAMRSYPSMAEQVINDCSGFRGSVEDVPPMMRLY